MFNIISKENLILFTKIAFLFDSLNSRNGSYTH